MPTVTELPNYKVIMEGSNVENTVEDKTPIQTDTQPNKNPTTSIACRAIKCTGKVFLSLITIPIMAVLGTLFGFVAGAASAYYELAPPSWREENLLLLLVTVIVIPPYAVAMGGVTALIGFATGLCAGAEIADQLSLKPLKSLWTEMTDALSNEEIEDVIMNPSEDICRHIVQGTPLQMPYLYA